jgi:hypothetical protein
MQHNATDQERAMRRPGKYEGCMDQELGARLYEMTLDGAHDEEMGDVDTYGWYGLILGDGPDDESYIVTTDSAGFFDYTAFPTPNDALDAWAAIEAEYAATVGEEE